MKKAYQVPAIEVTETLPFMPITASGETPSTTVFTVKTDEVGIGYGGGGDGTAEHGGAARSNGSYLWDE